MRAWYHTLFTQFFCILLIASPLSAQEAKIYEANKGRIGVMTGSATGTYVKIGSDLSSVLDGEYGLRIISMLGRGAQSNIKDMLYLTAVDMGLVQSDVLTQIRLTDPSHEALRKISYISKIYNEELHILASRTSGIKSISDLQGRRVSIGDTGSGSSLTAQLVLKFLDVDVSAQKMRKVDALEALKSGSIDAMMFVAGKPTAFASGISASENLQLIPVPYSDLLSGTYQPSQFTSNDYPALVEGKFVETISVGAILAVYDDHAKNSNRYATLIAFCKALLDNQNAFQNSARHEKWSEFDPSDTVPGWRRFEPMMKLLAGDKIAKGDTIEDIMENQ
jgi:TRAP transporter TAXI family solute receptor